MFHKIAQITMIPVKFIDKYTVLVYDKKKLLQGLKPLRSLL